MKSLPVYSILDDGAVTGGAPVAWSAPGPLGGHEPTTASPPPAAGR